MIEFLVVSQTQLFPSLEDEENLQFQKIKVQLAPFACLCTYVDVTLIC